MESGRARVIGEIEVRTVRKQRARAFDMAALQSEHQRRAPARVAPLGRRVALEKQHAAVDLTRPCGKVERRRRVRALPTLYDKLAIKGLRRAAAKDESQPFDVAASDGLAATP